MFYSIFFYIKHIFALMHYALGSMSPCHSSDYTLSVSPYMSSADVIHKDESATTTKKKEF